MSYLNSLPELLRPFAREIFPSDPVRTVNLTNMNRYTRMYLRRIIQRATSPPVNLIITDHQLARLLRVPLIKFSQWFHHGVRVPKVFRRARWFLREMIVINIEEDRGQSDEAQDRSAKQQPIRWPNRRTKAIWKQRIDVMREEYQNQGPVITDLAEANELIELMQGGYSPSISFSAESDITDFGEDPSDEHVTGEDAHESIEFRGLIGPPVVLTELELLDQFKNICITSEKLGELNSDDDEVPLF